MPYPQKGFTYPFKGRNGDAKGKPLADVETADLMYYIQSADPDDVTYGEKNRKMIAECQRIIAGRNQGAPSVSNAPKTTSNGVADTILAEIRAIRAENRVIKQLLETTLGSVRREPEEEAPASARRLFSNQNAHPEEESPF